MTIRILAVALVTLFLGACDRSQDTSDQAADEQTDGGNQGSPGDRAESPIQPREKRVLPPPPLNKTPPPFKLAASHVLIQYKGAERAKVDRSKADAQELAQKVLAKATGGEDFAKLANDHSDGPTKASGGYLNAFAEGQMVPAFSKAVSAVSPGEVVPELVETQFGFHIIRREPVRHLGHVLIQHTKARRAHTEVTRGEDDARTEIAAIRALLTKEGADMSAIARERSDCRLTKEVGGDLGFYGKQARLLPAMMKASNTLGAGEVSEIFESDFGFHVMWRFPEGLGPAGQAAGTPAAESGEAAPATPEPPSDEGGSPE